MEDKQDVFQLVYVLVGVVVAVVGESSRRFCEVRCDPVWEVGNPG